MSNDSAPGSQSAGRTMTKMRAACLMSLVMLGALGVGLLAVEGVVRAFLPVTDLPVTFFDPVTGPRVSPNQSGRWVIGDHIDSPYRFNKQGWNNAEDYVIPKPANTVRVCMVGDSQIESLQVECKDAMYSVAQRKMSAAGRASQWYSFGNSGWGTAQHTELIRHYVLDYRPDVVILLFVQNDPFDCSPYLVKVAPQVPMYWLTEDGGLMLRPPSYWQPSTRGRLAISSATYRYFIAQKKVFSRHSQVRSVGGLPLLEGVEAAHYEQVPGLSGMSVRERQVMTWKLIEALLTRNRDECARRGARFAVAFRGWSEEIEAPTGSTWSPAAPGDTDPYCLDGPRFSEMGREQVGPICQRLGIPYLDLTAGLMEVVKSGRSTRFPDDNHLSAAGHEGAGIALAAWVETIVGMKDQSQGSPPADSMIKK